jgi:GDPmannose 4,6-dehydratase
VTQASERVLVTGVTGQDGWYLARRLLELGHEVVGTSHRAEVTRVDVAGRAVDVVHVPDADLARLQHVVREHRPRAVFNFAARASSSQLFDDPLATARVNGLLVATWLEAIRLESPGTRFCQASSSEVFAGATTSPQDETTAVRPLSAYGAAKAYADHLVAAYRATHGLFACSAVLFSHESPRRPSHFLMRKVARAAARIGRGANERLTVGDLDAVRDWGYAPDYVEAMRLMLGAEQPADYVIATGQAHTVRDVCRVAFEHVGLEWQRHVTADEELKRPPERVVRVGNAARARRELRWATSCDFEQLVRLLVDADRKALEQEVLA